MNRMIAKQHKKAEEEDRSMESFFPITLRFTNI
jgi:hypothetical protein